MHFYVFCLSNVGSDYFHQFFSQIQIIHSQMTCFVSVELHAVSVGLVFSLFSFAFELNIWFGWCWVCVGSVWFGPIVFGLLNPGVAALEMYTGFCGPLLALMKCIQISRAPPTVCWRSLPAQLPRCIQVPVALCWHS